MRTKALFCAAALAAGAFSSMAQSSNVYSLNVVGYVNLPVAGLGSYSLICNPLNNTNNNITNLFGSVTPDNSTIVRWNPTIADFQSASYVYNAGAHKWFNAADFSGFILNPGEGVFFIADGGAPTFTNTFVGEVIQGNYTNFVMGAGAYNMLGSSAPIGGSFTNALGGMNPSDNDTVAFWNVGATDLDPNSFTYNIGTHVWSPNGAPTYDLPPGVGFIYIADGNAPNKTWIRNFTVQ